MLKIKAKPKAYPETPGPRNCMRTKPERARMRNMWRDADCPAHAHEGARPVLRHMLPARFATGKAE